MANEDENNCTNVPTNQKSSWSSFLKSIATFSGDLSSLTAPSFILSPTSLCEFPSYWVCCNLKKKKRKKKQTEEKKPSRIQSPSEHAFVLFQHLNFQSEDQDKISLISSHLQINFERPYPNKTNTK